jgi:hypothetical protein
MFPQKFSMKTYSEIQEVKLTKLWRHLITGTLQNYPSEGQEKLE